VLSYLFRPLGAAALIGVAVLSTGCQTYEPRPLRPEDHRLAWHARTPGDEPVRAFAERLAQSGQVSAFDPSDGLTLEEAEVVALVYNPALRLQRLRAGVVAASAGEAGRWKDPTFSCDLLRITESVPSPWVLTPGLALTIPLSGRLEAEKDRADATIRVALTEIAEQEWKTRFDLRSAWLQWSAARLRAEHIEPLLASVEALVVRASKLGAAGEIPATEAGLFALERVLQQKALRKARDDAKEWLLRVHMQIGLSPEAQVVFVPTLQIPKSGTRDLDASGPETLTLRRLREEYEVAEQTLRMEISKQFPDLVIGPLYETDQGQSRIGFFGALPIPVLNANVQAIAEARAARELARASYETAYEQLVGSFEVEQVRQRSLSADVRFLEDEIVPLVDKQLETAHRMFELGEGGALTLLESVISAGAIRSDLVDARLQAALSHVELARLTTAQMHPTVNVDFEDDSDPTSEPELGLQEVVP